MPGSHIDPHFGAFADEFSRLAKEAGFGSHERLLPESVPLELVAGHPVMRFRRKPGAWPLFQIGPGLFTANIVPPYEGWRAFRYVLREGLGYLFDAYPFHERYLKLNHIALRYIDGFAEEHGYSNFNEFLSNDLQISVNFPTLILDQFASSQNAYFTNIETVIELKTPELSIGTLKFARGTKDTREALIGELTVRREQSIEDKKIDFLSDWFDIAHHTLRSWFDILSGEELKKKMGPTRAVEGE
jgi:uncharacterized protein (TIGR04255 family)